MLYAKVNDLLQLAAKHPTLQVDVPESINLIYAPDIGYLVDKDVASQIVAAKIAGVVELSVKLHVQPCSVHLP